MSEKAFLTDSEVRRLTGTGEKLEQLEYLREKGIRHWGPNRAGKIIVPRSAIDGEPEVQITGGWAPDFKSLGV